MTVKEFQLNELEGVIKQFFFQKNLLSVVLSHPKKKNDAIPLKITIRPLLIKKRLSFQATEEFIAKAIHKNYSSEDCVELICNQLSTTFREIRLFHKDQDIHIWRAKDIFKMRLSKPTGLLKPLEHNKKKKYLLEEGMPIPFFVALNVMDSKGKVLQGKRDKFRQINRFLEIIADTLQSLDLTKPIRIVDFGCGKAYLTFALYHYLHNHLGIRVEILGLDLKKDVVDHLKQISAECGYEGLLFAVGDIGSYKIEAPIDMMVSLHACDTATDYALEKAICLGTKVILAVPCCQHELFNQITNRSLRPLLKFGILKERFSALATDACRASILSILGYETQILEFINLEHTAKNLLIRAIKKDGLVPDPKLMQEYAEFKEMLGVSPALEKRFSSLL